MAILVPEKIAAEQRQEMMAAMAARQMASPVEQPTDALRATAKHDFMTPAEAIKQFLKLEEVDNIPTPVGHRILVLGLEPPETVGVANLVVVDSYRVARSAASPQGIVLALGPGAYPEDRNPEGAWCRKGDRVLFQSYAGREYELATGQKLFILNDDEIMAVVDHLIEEDDNAVE